VFEPQELELLEQEEHDSEMRLAAARQRLAESGEEPQEKDHDHIRQLEAEWKHAVERLHHARQSAGS
jgi:hypothetical protein